MIVQGIRHLTRAELAEELVSVIEALARGPSPWDETDRIRVAAARTAEAELRAEIVRRSRRDGLAVVTP